MRRPAEEDDRVFGASGACDLAEHALLGGFHDVEIAEIEGVLLDHVEDQAVAVIARLDAVDLAVQLVGELGDVGEALEPLVEQVLRHRQRVFGAGQVGLDVLDRPVLEIGRDVGLHGGHPVAEEDVDVLVLHGGEGHRHRQDLGVGVVAEALEDFRRDGGRRRDVRPADIGEADRRTGLRFLGERRGADESGAEHGGCEHSGKLHGDRLLVGRPGTLGTPRCCMNVMAIVIAAVARERNSSQDLLSTAETPRAASNSLQFRAFAVGFGVAACTPFGHFPQWRTCLRAASTVRIWHGP